MVASATETLDERICALEAALKEKDAALREVQHRAKNSLQLVLSLLKLQSGRIRDPEARSAYDQTLQRIEVLMIVYRQLHESRGDSSIDLAGYLRELVDLVRVNIGEKAGRVEMGIEVEDLSIGLYTAVPIGLVVNELLLNSLRHAFPEDGWIRVRLSRGDGRMAELVVADNGRGLPEGFDEDADASMLLVDALVGQIRGQLGIERRGGTKVLLKFPL